MSQLPPGFVLDGAPQAPVQGGPVYGAPPAPNDPPAPKTTWRQATINGRPVQISSEGKVEDLPGNTGSNTLDPKTQEGMRNIAAGILKNTGVNFQTGDDPVSDLILKSTSGGLQKAGADAYGYVTGTPTEGMKAIASLKPMLADMTLQMAGGSLGAQISDGDRKFIMERMGNIADPSVTAEERLASWYEVKRRLAQMSGIEMARPEDNVQLGDQGGLVGSVTDTRPADPAAYGGNPPNDPNGGGGGGIWEGIKQGTGSMVAGAGDIIGIVGNPLNATINSIAGTNLSTDLGSTLRDALGLPKNVTGTDAIIRAGTGAGVGAGLARGAAAITNPGAVQNALAIMGRTPGADAVAGSAAGGATEIARRNNVGPVGQVAAGLAGGVAGYGGANALARAVGPRAPNAMMQAADQLGVQMMPADVGGVGTRMATGALGRTLGGIPIAEGAQAAVKSAGNARTTIAKGIGDVTDATGAGQAVKKGFDSFTKNSNARADQLYERVSVDPSADVQLANTRTALADVTRGLQSNPELSKLWANHPRLRATLEALTPQDLAPQGREAFAAASDRLTKAMDRYEQIRNQVVPASELAAARQEIDAARAAVSDAQAMANSAPVGGNLSWQDMQGFRSIVGEIIGQPGIARDGSDIAALRKLYGALTTDMEVTAAQAGPRALSQFRRANQFWRGREARVDEVFSALLGKDGNRSDTAVFNQINTWAQSRNGDFGRIARTIRSLPEDQANTVRATIVDRMGRASAAKQDATGDVFSPAEFATQWRGMDDRAKMVLFPNQQHRQDLERLATLMDGMKRASEYQNFSNTGLAVNATAQGVLALSNPLVAASLAALQFGGGKLLASPKFARIIASTSKMPANAAQRALPEQLKVLATREPMLAGDISRFLDAANSNTTGALAADPVSDQQRK